MVPATPGVIAEVVVVTALVANVQDGPIAQTALIARTAMIEVIALAVQSAAQRHAVVRVLVAKDLQGLIIGALRHLDLKVAIVRDAKKTSRHLRCFPISTRTLSPNSLIALRGVI